MKPGLYDMIRSTDQTGVSGTGRVAQMAVFEDGSATVRWLTGKDSTVCWAKVQDAVDVHINCHPDTTKLVPVGAQAETEKSIQHKVHKKARPNRSQLETAVIEWCVKHHLRWDRHDSHVLYFDVWIHGERYMFDCSPEDKPRSYQRLEPGRVVVRNSTYRIGAVNFLTGKGLTALAKSLLLDG